MYYYNYYKDLFRTFARELIKQDDSHNHNTSGYLDLGIINPTIGTSNLGDFIIYEAVKNELNRCFPNDFFTDFPSQLHTIHDTKRQMAKKDFLFVSGTNLLSSNMDSRYQWKIGPGHQRFLRNKIILCGVGWWQYQNNPNKYTRELYKNILSSDHLHSVRDSYTKEMLFKIGIKNVVNTSCPTLWNLTPEFCDQIQTKKSRNVVTTLTYYKSDPDLDRRMLENLVNKYEKVYLWVQGLEDVNYLNQIFPKSDCIHLVSPSIEAYNNILEKSDIEYLGTRLHAGIKAIQKGKRALILAVDNRAIEIAKDTNLNVIKRENVDEIFEFTDKNYKTKISLPQDSINEWRESLSKLKIG